MEDITNFPFIVTEHTIDGQHVREYPNATVDPNSTFKLVLKSYTPIDNPNPQPGDVTIIGAHGCGFPKVSKSNPILHAKYLRNTLAKRSVRSFTNLYGKTYLVGVDKTAIAFDLSGLPMSQISVPVVLQMRNFSEMIVRTQTPHVVV